MKIKYWFITFCFLLLYSCSGESNSRKEERTVNPNTVKLISEETITLNNSVLTIIEDYTKKYDYNDDFVIHFYESKLPLLSTNKEKSSFVLAPVNIKSTFLYDKPLFYFELNNKKIYILCGIENLAILSERRDKEFLDSLKADDNIDYSTWSKKEEFLGIDDTQIISVTLFENDSVFVNTRPDTIFIKPIRPFVSLKDLIKIK